MIESLQRDHAVDTVAQDGGIDRIPKKPKIERSVAQNDADGAVLEGGKRTLLRQQRLLRLAMKR